MERQRIIEILEAYRPGEGLETDPEVRQALELAARDSELSSLRQDIQAFDRVFSAKLDQIQVPDGLQESILAAARKRQQGSPSSGSSATPEGLGSTGSKIIQWFYPASFAAAAAIIILLALSFTFWNRPGVALPGPDAGVLETAHSLYNSLNAKHRPDNGEDVLRFIQSNGGAVPIGLPGGTSFDESFACDVVEVNGKRVSIICFAAPDKSKTMHLFTFDRAAFPNVQIPLSPEVHNDGESCCATWLDERQGQIHVLYSDKGEQNLRQILDI